MALATVFTGRSVCSLAHDAQPLVHLQHELVKVDAAVGDRAQRACEQVHQHGLAPPHRSPEIDAAHRLRFAPEQPAEQPGPGMPWESASCTACNA